MSWKATRVVALCRALDLGDDPDAVLRSLFDVYEAVDREVAAASSGLDLPCREGCDACCHESVFLSAPEFLAVARELLDRFDQSELERIVAEMRALAERYEDELELLSLLEAGEERDEVAARIKFRCPLLSQDGRCSVYRARELNARTFGLTWDRARDHVYGCELTASRLRVLPDATGGSMYDARAARRLLKARVPATGLVHVYPWWFARYGSFFV